MSYSCSAPESLAAWSPAHFTVKLGAADAPEAIFCEVGDEGDFFWGWFPRFGYVYCLGMMILTVQECFSMSRLRECQQK